MSVRCLVTQLSLLLPLALFILGGAWLLHRLGLRALSRISQGIAATIVGVAVLRVAADPVCIGLCTLVEVGLMDWWTAFLMGCWCSAGGVL